MQIYIEDNKLNFLSITFLHVIIASQQNQLVSYSLRDAKSYYKLAMIYQGVNSSWASYKTKYSFSNLIFSS